ncbi:putative Cytosolic Protein [Pediococcus damnosus]|uniref:Cytosolic Protein n=1 Tax=Pediococcus damnosus TaxID=51663 RepID=A0A0R2HA85_9LACO|nr:YlbG family protein [Pediococcus damnosus]AMV59810.1 putative Cytosolic Protein [Pediococcus damnosus]AMV61898.1 putative Cytosolic Protein [Pediococcus damnosus]AMV64056.1 putative Cytosolic Protein [Pediococcus damnosus]AMV66228.1 putative Cytosolic Protein [Pediococcus damnosus]AMV68507.1 putative Cytosolic Protein [Pediococcus damnosus]
MEFKLQPRESIIVNLGNMRQVKQLKKFGIVYYVSKSMKYAVLYTDKDKAEQACTAIGKLSSVKQAEISPRAELRTNYDDDESTDYKRTNED